MLRHVVELVVALLVAVVLVSGLRAALGERVAELVLRFVEVLVRYLMPPVRRARLSAIARARPLAGEADSEGSLDQPGSATKLDFSSLSPEDNGPTSLPAATAIMQF